MQGVLLESASLDRYLSLGKSGYPVFQSAQQILATLAKHPELLPFFAVPQPNEKGSQIDWYSPTPGHVIAWNNASDEEKAQARQQLQAFTVQLQAKGQEYIEHGRKGRPDSLLFGELLQEACKIPSTANIYLVAPHAGTATAHTSAIAGQWAEPGQAAASAETPAAALQPVLTFWGFVGNEEDRHKAPLYFLTPPPVKLAPAPVLAPATDTVVPPKSALIGTSTSVQPAVAPAVVAPVLVQPWWKRWWLWLALFLLLLLALFLLRGCMPRVGIPGLPGLGLPSASLPSVGVPNVDLPNVDLPNASLPNVNLPEGGLPAGTLPALSGNVEAPTLPAGTTLPAVDPLAPQGVAPSAELMAQAPAATPALPNAAPPLGQEPVAPELPTAQAKAAAPAMPEPPQLEIPKQAADGVAQFLNGKYSTRGGLVDDKTNEPLRLQYDFENGKGQVEIKRSNGVTCKGNVVAAMQKGSLGIANQGGTSCDDGSSYDMPKIQCKPGATSVADCTGEYGKHQFPIQMQRKST